MYIIRAHIYLNIIDVLSSISIMHIHRHAYIYYAVECLSIGIRHVDAAVGAVIIVYVCIEIGSPGCIVQTYASVKGHPEAYEACIF